ncbi:hypothetical protein BJ508DRAFT_344233 [Ascobolus immersus RN42]|uniref:Uncharacterized protein n=1 Tax=Ascobolus immersus RN42 TaxID=1160509 RepID=A0A3N4HDC4_ASCIM|nr:hypothetical protein BJ508DRAFT_344233 [Ascobolus immersus RN42]
MLSTMRARKPAVLFVAKLLSSPSRLYHRDQRPHRLLARRSNILAATTRKFQLTPQTGKDRNGKEVDRAGRSDKLDLVPVSASKKKSQSFWEIATDICIDLINTMLDLWSRGTVLSPDAEDKIRRSFENVEMAYNFFFTGRLKFLVGLLGLAAKNLYDSWSGQVDTPRESNPQHVHLTAIKSLLESGELAESDKWNRIGAYCSEHWKGKSLKGRNEDLDPGKAEKTRSGDGETEAEEGAKDEGVEGGSEMADQGFVEGVEEKTEEMHRIAEEELLRGKTGGFVDPGESKSEGGEGGVCAEEGKSDDGEHEDDD